MDKNKLPSKEAVERLREAYPEGTRIELVSMNDPYANLKHGDKGVVSFVDDTGTIFADWDNGSGLGIVYGADICRKVESEISKPPMSDRNAILDCVEGLGFYAACQARDNSFAAEVGETRKLIEDMVPYWKLDEVKPLKQSLDTFDELVDEAKHGAFIDADPAKVCGNIVSGLYKHGLELVTTHGGEVMGGILTLSDTIKAVSEYFDHEPEKAVKMSELLAAGVKEMLGEYDIPGQETSGLVNVGYEIKRAVLFNNDMGFALAHNPIAGSPFVTWQMSNDNGTLSFETGHYFESEVKAFANYISRSEDYKDTYKLTEKPLPDPEKKLITFIDSRYRELFQIPDGESINVIYPRGDGRGTLTRECKYLDDHHFSVKGGDVYHICQFAEIMERLGARYEPSAQINNIILLPFSAEEDKFYSPNREDVNTSVGFLSGDFGNGGDRFSSNWTKHGGGAYTAEVQSELQSVIYALRQDLLKDHASMLAYCESHPDARLPESDKLKIYGFKLETDTRQYFVRCFAEKDSRFSVYAYADKPAPEHSREGRDYTSVLKAIAEDKKAPKPPRKSASKQRDKGNDEI